MADYVAPPKYPLMWVNTLLKNPKTFERIAESRYKQFDTNENGTLEQTEVVALADRLSHDFGLDPPDDGKIAQLFQACDKNHDDVLSFPEFLVFYKSFLKSAKSKLEKPLVVQPVVATDMPDDMCCLKYDLEDVVKLETNPLQHWFECKVFGITKAKLRFSCDREVRFSWNIYARIVAPDWVNVVFPWQCIFNASDVRKSSEGWVDGDSREIELPSQLFQLDKDKARDDAHLELGYEYFGASVQKPIRDASLIVEKRVRVLIGSDCDGVLQITDMIGTVLAAVDVQGETPEGRVDQIREAVSPALQKYESFNVVMDGEVICSGLA